MHWQSIILAGSQLWIIVFILLAFTMAVGAGLVVRLPPSLTPYRFQLSAPLGFAGIAVICGITSLCGLPVKFPALAIIGATIAGLSILGYRGKLSFPQRRIFLTEWLPLVGLGTILVFFSSLILYNYPGARLSDTWGSSDLFAYWTLGDYLDSFGGTVHAYHSQTIFHSEELLQHLSFWGRPSTNAMIAFFRRAFFLEDSYLLINPLIVAAVFAQLLLLRVLLLTNKIKSWLPLLATVLCPFTYFFLYYSYLSQAFAAVFFLSFFIVYFAWLNETQDNYATLFVLGLLWVTLLTSHEPFFLAAVFVLFLWLVSSYLSRSFSKSKLGMSLLVLFFSALPLTPFLFRIIKTLVTVSRQNPMPGWNWARLLGITDLTGLSTMLGDHIGHNPPVMDQFLLGIVVIALCSLGLWKLRQKRALLFMFVFELALCLSALRIVFYSKIPNSTHTYVKSLSLFAIFVPFLAAIGLLALQDKRGKHLRFVVGILFCFWFGTEGQVLITKTNYAKPRYRAELIPLVRKQLEKDPQVLIHMSQAGTPFPLNTRFYVPIVRDTRRLVQDPTAIGKREILSVWEQFRKPLSEIDRCSTHYCIGKPRLVEVIPPRWGGFE